MIFGIIDISISIAVSLSIYFGVGSVNTEWLSWTWCWLPLVFFIGSYLSVIVIWTLFLIIAGLFIDTKKRHKPNKFGIWILNQSAYQILFFTRVKVIDTGLEKLPKDRKYFGIFNHSSSWDAIAMYKYLKTVYISKKGNVKDFIVGPWIEYSGSIPIDRDNLFASLGSIKEAGQYLKGNVVNVCVSPEGTRSKERQLLPFHAVVFEAAKTGQAPIAIFALQNCQAAGKRIFLHRTKVYIDLIEVIPYEQYKDMKTAELSEMCRTKLLTHLEAHKDRLVYKDGIE
ncbi:MAG: 1-acyl-sn-glycerol-3-phosphate acyltransferase [Bacilli bacterium]|nr:1-acyl-sn-glycerol-3-phosphate acyltransferase [Bacilli bacterium]